MIEPPELELKKLPEHLEYAFLQGDEQLLVVISSILFAREKTELLEVYKSHKRSIAWSITDIKGIDSSFHTHKILIEDVVKPQRRVNPNIKEVGGMGIVKNEKNELIPQRMVIEWRGISKFLSPQKIKKRLRSLAHMTAWKSSWMIFLFSKALSIIALKPGKDSQKTKSFEDVSLGAKVPKFFGNAIVVLQEDIMGLPPLREKFLRPDSTGLISFVMRENSSKLTTRVSEPIIFLQGMQHPKSTYRNKYILVAIDYVSKWVEAQFFPTSDA
ncbi:hypothetical protein Tco_0030752 [Tanacetum coccineum]